MTMVSSHRTINVHAASVH